MIRWLAMIAAQVLLAPAFLRLYGETRYVMRGAEPIASIAAVEKVIRDALPAA